MTPSSTPTAEADISRFAGMRAEVARKPEEALAKVAREFEAMFVQMMLKSAREAAPEGGLLDSNEGRLYQEMFDEQVALGVAQRGTLGFDRMLRRQFDAYLAPTRAAGERAALVAATPPSQAPLATRVLAPPAASQPAPLVDAPAGNPSSAPLSLLDAERQQFAASLREPAERAAARLGTTPEILIAQAALETGWGRHVMGAGPGQTSNNLFGVKASRGWDGQSVTQRTVEVLGGKPVQVNADFRAYDSIDQAFNDYVDFITGNPRYQQALDKAADPRAYIQELQRAGYATDPNYARKILKIHDQVAANASSGSG